MRQRRWHPAVLVVGVIILMTAGWTIFLLTRPAPKLAATNSRVLISGVGIEVPGGDQRCQNQDWVPGDARTARVFVDAGPTNQGPPLQLTVQGADGRTSAQVDVPAGYPSGPLLVPVHPPGTVDPATICIRNLGNTSAFFAGNLTLASAVDPGAHIRGTDLVITQRDVNGVLRGDDIRVDFFSDDSSTFFSEASTIAERFALYKPHLGGDALMYIVLAVFVVVAGAGVFLAVRAANGNVAIRTAAIVIAVVAVGHAWVWAFTAPPGQIPDEAYHVAYTDYLSATHHLPPLHPGPDDPNATLPGYNLIWDAVAFSATEPANWSAARDAALRQALDHLPYATNQGSPAAAAPYPPLYYAYEAVPARLARPLDALDRLYVLRLWSGLLLGATALGVFWFLREALPGRPATWVYGSLAVALLPLAAFMAGGVNNDNLLYAEAAVLLALTARCLRTGIDRRNALGLAVVAVVGILTKPTIAILFPGVAIALVIAARRYRERSLRPLLEAGGLAAGALGVWAVICNRWSGRSVSQALGLSGGTELSAKAGPVSLRAELSYLWQYFLPRLPNMTRPVQRLDYPVYDVYWRGLVGLYGYFAYGFSYNVTRWALLIGFTVVGFAVATLVFERQAVQRRWGDLVVYAVVVVTALLFMASVGYRQLVATDVSFEQTRYLFPLLALYGGVVALAAGYRRWTAIAGPAIVAVAGAHAWFSLLLTIRHYYA